MSDNTLIPTPAASDLPSFKILIDGAEINQEYQVAAVDVSKMYNKISFAKIKLCDGNTAEQDFKISSSDDFKPGNKIEIQAGYHQTLATIFKGIIIKHSIKSNKNKTSSLNIEAKDESIKLTIGRKCNYFYDSSDTDIIEEILGNYSLQSEVESTGVTHKEMVQHYASDWDFILSRAEMNGMLVFTDNGKLIIKKPDTSASPLFTANYGANLMEIEAEMDARDQFDSITGFAWSSADQDLSEEEASAPSYDENGNIASSDLAKVIGLENYELKHSGNINSDELKNWTDSVAMKSALSRICGRAKFQGTPDVKPGSVLELNGTGDRFNGNVFVTGVRHQINDKNWETDTQFGLKNDWFHLKENVIDSAASGLVPGIHGLQIATVVQLENDPDGEDRIQVCMPVIDKKEVGIWARIATLDAGNKRGSFFRPEIGDEVVLGYLNNDPRHPIVVGMLNSSALPAPLTASDDNHEKGFVTRSEMKVIFNDDEKSISINTPAGKSIVLSEKEGSIIISDENNNSLTMDSAGVTIESGKDIILKATGDIKAEGVNINQTANAQYKAEGSAGAELSTGATAVIKGSIVQIN